VDHLFVKFSDPLAALVFEISSEKKQTNSDENPTHSTNVGVDNYYNARHYIH